MICENPLGREEKEGHGTLVLFPTFVISFPNGNKGQTPRCSEERGHKERASMHWRCSWIHELAKRRERELGGRPNLRGLARGRLLDGERGDFQLASPKSADICNRLDALVSSSCCALSNSLKMVLAPFKHISARSSPSLPHSRNSSRESHMIELSSSATCAAWASALERLRITLANGWEARSTQGREMVTMIGRWSVVAEVSMMRVQPPSGPGTRAGSEEWRASSIVSPPGEPTEGDSSHRVRWRVSFPFCVWIDTELFHLPEPAPPSSSSVRSPRASSKLAGGTS